MNEKCLQILDENKKELIIIPLDKIDLLRLGFRDKNTLILEVNRRKIIIKESEAIKKVLSYFDILWMEEKEEKEEENENKSRSE
jgi:hypothetical protein